MILQVLIAIDQLLNSLTGGWADETLSARIWRNTDKSWYWHSLHFLVDFMFFWQVNHCYQAYLSELNRKQLSPSYSSN